MCRILLVLAIVGAAYADSAKRCDPFLIGQIRNYWGNAPPTKILEGALVSGREVVYATTKGNFPDAIKGVYVETHNEACKSPLTTVSVYRVPFFGKTEKRDNYLEEEKKDEGTIYSPASKIRKYFITNKGGVSGVYSCSEDLSAEDGDPVAYVKVNADETKVSGEALKETKDIFKKLGIVLTKEYEDFVKVAKYEKYC